MLASWVTPAAPTSAATWATISSATRMSAFGIVKLMSVVPSFDVFWTIMSTLTFAPASGSNSAAEIPAGRARQMIVTFDSETSVTTPEMIGSSMLGSSR